MACGARSGLKLILLVWDKANELWLNGLWSPFEGRKYSGSRIGGEDVACVECAVISFIPARDVPSLGTRGGQCRRSERCMSDTKGAKGRCRQHARWGVCEEGQGLASRRSRRLGQLAEFGREQGGIDGTSAC